MELEYMSAELSTTITALLDVAFWPSLVMFPVNYLIITVRYCTLGTLEPLPCLARGYVAVRALLLLT